MKIPEKKLCSVGLILVVVLAISFVQVCRGYIVESTVQDDAIAVITNVVGLDLAKYKTDLTFYASEQPEIYGGLVRERLTYTLEATGRKVQISCEFLNKTLVCCYMYPLEGSLLYAKPLYDNIVATAKEVLQRYQANLGTMRLQEEITVLDQVTEIKPMNVTSGDFKVEIISSGGYEGFVWYRTVNGFDYPLYLSVEFVNGELKGFSDLSSFYRIGSVDIKISQDEAIRIAREKTKTLTLSVLQADGSYKDVAVNLREEPIRVMKMVGPREPLTLHPLWYVEFSLNEVVGGTTGAQAGIWADTGEIAYAQLTGHHGVVPDENPSNQSPTPSQNSSNQTLALYLFAGTATTVIVATALLLLLKKRRSK